MDLGHLRYFYEVARQQSFTKASRTLRVSQPSISKAVRALEEAQAVRLLDRTRRSVNLTPAGEVFFRRCERIFGELAELEHELEASKEECSGPLHIGCSDNLANYVMPAIVASFLENHPKVTVVLFAATSAGIKEDMLRGRTEVGVFFTPPKEDAFACRKLGFVEFAVTCATHSRHFANWRFDARELSKRPHVGCGRVEYTRSYPVLGMLKSVGVTPSQVVEANAQETQKRLAMQDLGYAVLPRFVIEDELKRGTLRTLALPKPIGAHAHWVVRRGRTLSRPAQVFREHLLRELPAALKF